MSESINVTLKVWRQSGPGEAGRFETYPLENVSTHASFLEMLDVLNEQLTTTGKEPVAFDSDCREGICDMCGFLIDGEAHGPQRNATVCQLHMRHFKDGDVITIEPWRAKPFPVVRDLVVDRSAFDRIIQSGGYVSVRTGSAPEANLTPVERDVAERAMDAAACIGCGACVAACKNASAMLFVGAKVTHLNLLPQGKAEKDRRVLKMVSAMDEAGFGSCTNYGECQAVCPKGISLDVIATMNRHYAQAKLRSLLHRVV